MSAIAAISTDTFTTEYIRCALLTETDNEGKPLDKHFHGMEDVGPATLHVMIADCKRFQQENEEDLKSGTTQHGAHDFWLTRRGHGAGFWDGGWPEPQASRLDAAANSFGDFELYVGHDGKIWACGAEKER